MSEGSGWVRALRPREWGLLAASAGSLVALVLVLVLAGGGSNQRSFRYDDPFPGFRPGGSVGAADAVPDAPSLRRELTQFLPFVATDVQDFWQREFQRSGLTYRPTQVVVFLMPALTPCGVASAATGPFYCALDRRVYLDLGFFRALAVEFHAPGDFAQAYVIAHEIGHHVQDLTGVFAQVQHAIQQRLAPPNALSIRLELQADCLAGVWGHSTYERRLLDRGDVAEALRAAAAVGDDRVQKRTIGRIEPERWTHGSSAQRQHWYARGFVSGDPDACDTFSDGV